MVPYWQKIQNWAHMWYIQSELVRMVIEILHAGLGVLIVGFSYLFLWPISSASTNLLLPKYALIKKQQHQTEQVHTTSTTSNNNITHYQQQQ